MSKKRNHSKNNKKEVVSSKKKSYYTLFFFLLTITSVLFIWLFLYLQDQVVSDNQELNKNSKTVKDNSDKIKHLQNLLKEKDIKSINVNTDYNYLSEIDDLETSLKQKKKLIKNIKPKIKQPIKKDIPNKYKPLTIHNNKPKLAIIIDDITTFKNIQDIKSLNLPITMSFLPPTPSHPNSAKITKNLHNIMIHIPLEATAYIYAETNTLSANATKQQINARVLQLKRLYPQAKYINNHTGSKFTSSQQSMDYLFEVLKKHNLIFVDSRTTPDTKSKFSAKKLNYKFLMRDTFIDNKPDITYIHNQLKIAVAHAKEYGYSIAIGHPRNTTIKAIKSAKYILKDVELVYINQISEK